MKRFFRGLLTGLNVLLIACLLLCSLLFVYLSVTGRAALFGYTVSLIDIDGVSLTLTAGDAPQIEAGDLILCRGADGTVSVQSAAYASDSAVYFYDADGSLGAVPLTGLEFAGKLLWQSRTAGRILQAVARPPAKWILLGGMSILLTVCIACLIITGVRRRRTASDKQDKQDAQLLHTFSVTETSSLIRTELFSAEEAELIREKAEETEPTFAKPDNAMEIELSKSHVQETPSAENERQTNGTDMGKPLSDTEKSEQARKTASPTVEEILEDMRRELTSHD